MAGFDNDVLYADNVDFSGGSPVTGKITTDGQLLIGSTAAPNIRVATLTAGNNITPSNGSGSITLNLTGTTDHAIQLGNASGSITSASTLTNGQLLIGSTGADPVAASLTAGTNIVITPGAGTITIDAAGGSGISTLTGNSGGAISPAAGNINIVTSNSTVTFVGSGSTLTQDFNLTNLVFGSTLPSLTSGDFNVGVGSLAIPSITSATSCTAVGYAAGVSTTTGNSNTFIGFGTGQTASTSQQNTAVGASSLAGATTGVGGHTSVGYDSLSTVATGVFNVAIGYQAGKSLTLADSHNICIGNTGTAGDNNVMRLGAQGTGTRQVSVTYLAGQLNLLSGLVVKVTTPGAYPYTTLITDYLILVDTSSARTITPMASPTAGQVLVIKDSVGSAATNNITITPSGKNIDGAASTTINIAYGSVTIVYGGTEWSIC